jgi:hypothetical protein
MKLIIGCLIAIVIVLILAFVPIMEFTYADAEPLSYQATELVKKEQRNLNPELTQAYEEILVAYVSVRNTDTVSGTFDVHIAFYTPTGHKYAIDVTLQLSPDEQKEAKYGVSSVDANITGANIDELSWDYKVTPGRKSVTKHKKGSIFEYLLFP